MRLHLFLASLSAAVVFSPAIARAEPAPAAAEPAATPEASGAERFRRAGSVVLGDVAGVGVGVGGGGGLGAPLTLGWLTYVSSVAQLEGHPAASSARAIGFSPTADLFVAAGLSIGGRAAYTHFVSDSGPGAVHRYSSGSFEVMPRVGYAFPISDDVLFWPRLQVGVGRYDSSSTSASTTIGPDGMGVLGPPVTATDGGEILSFGADLPVVVPLGRHAAVTFGPELMHTTQRSESFGWSTRSMWIRGRGSLSLYF